MSCRTTDTQNWSTMTSKIVEQHIPCPTCQSSDAYCTYDDGHGYCFSCNYYKPSKEESAQEGYTYEYLPHRGLTKETLSFYDIKTKINSDGKPFSVGFRYPNDSYKVRLLEKKHFYSEGEISKAGLFGRNKFSQGSHKYVTITEGEYDAASLYQVLKAPVVSVRSSSSAASDCVLDRAWLNSFERIYLAFDGDAPGRDAVRAVAKLFDYNKVYVLKFTKRKDANEYLQAGEGDELRQIWWNAKRYTPESIVSSFAEFEEILKQEAKVGVSYPFKTLNDMTYGIRTGEMVLLKAQEKVGKTSIMHAIEHHLLKETKDAIGAIYLEEPKQRHLQSLAGLELRKPVHLPDSGVGAAEVFSTLTKLVGEDDRLHLYSHFGSDDPDTLLDTIRFLVSSRGCRYVLFDHITMAVTGLSGEGDERRALDYLSTRLEMMVKELDFALIMVSHVNDEGKTRGSRNMTKVADVVIDAKRDPMADDPLERRTIQLSVPFNRFCFHSGPAGKLRLDPATYTLEEVFDDFEGTDNGGRDLRLVPPQAS